MALTTFDEEAIEAAARRCADELGGPADVVFAFATPDFQPRLGELGEMLQVYVRSPRVVGCSANGFIGRGEENEGVAGVSLLALRLPGADCEVTAITDGAVMRGSEDEFEAPPGIVLMNPLRANVQAWIDAWDTLFPSVPLIGGLASGDFQGGNVFLFTEKGEADADALLVRWHGGVRIEPLLSQGCRPIGRAEMITEGDANIISKLGAEPAYEVLREAVQGLLDEGTEIVPGSIHAGFAVSEFIDEYRRGDFLIRNLFAADEKTGRVQIGAAAEVGRTLQFQLRDRDAADEDLRAQCAALKATAGDKPLAALLFSCAGRGQGFFGVPNHDAGLIEESFGPLPLAGFFCAGEIGPVGVTNHVHGYTASAAMIYPA